jgi:cellulase/cellobiase CelA1
VTNPGTQTGTVGTAAGVQVHATDSGTGQALTYSATGLPAGLSINASSGLISGTPTAAGTSSVTIRVTDATGAAGTATLTWTVSAAGGGGGTGGSGTCHVSYAKQTEWAGGFVANLTISDTGSAAITNWSLTFSFPGDQRITNGWNATLAQSGTAVTATNAGYNSTISPGGSTSLGFQGTWTSNDSSPTAFSVNGVSCS